MQAVQQETIRRNRLSTRWVLYALLTLPIGYYVVTVFRYAYNFPYMDDYPSVVDFLLKLPQATAYQKLQLLLEQNNFHRVVFLKALAWGTVVLTGSVSFTLMQYLGVAAWLLITWLLYRHTQPKTNQLLIFLPAAYLLFQFQFWNNTFWGMAAVCNLCVPAWALLSFSLAARGREGWAIATSLAAMFTVGNGILVLPLLLIHFLLTRRFRWFLIGLAVAVPVFGFYFSGYQNPAGTGAKTALNFSTLLHLLQLDTAFLGAMFYHPAVAWLSQVVGLATILWTVYLVFTRYDRVNPTLFWMLIFMHLTGLMLAVNRIQNSVDIIFASRYRNNTALLLAIVYLTLADVVVRRRIPQQRWLYGLTLAGAVGINLVSNVTYTSKIVRFRELKQSDQFLWQQYGIIHGCSPIYKPAEQLTHLTQAGMFQPGQLTAAQLTSQTVQLTPPPPTAGQLAYGLDLVRQTQRHLVVSGWATIKGQKANFNDTYLAVRTPTGWRFFTTLFHQRLEKEDALNDKDTGFTAIIPTNVIPTGEAAQLGIFVRSGKKTAFQEITTLPSTSL